MFYITLFCTVAVILAFFYSLFIIIGKNILHDKIDNFNLKLSVSLSFIILFSLLIYGLVTVQYNIEHPTIINGSAPDYSGTLGDLIGGVLNPILALFGILAGGLAFYAQYQANKQIQDQFKIQQFESRLFKMLDIYNNNVDNLNFITRKRGNLFNGKMVFPSLVSNFNQLKKDIKDFISKKEISEQSLLKKNYEKELQNINLNANNFVILEISYLIFLYGVGSNGRKNIKELLKNKYDIKCLNQILNYLSHKPIEYDEKNIEQIENWTRIFIGFENFNNPNNNKFDKYYNGHQNNLSHYYRHIFMIIKYINNQDFLTYNQKWEYSKLLRAQLSNHEQELFFLNSISILGREWELNYKSDNRRLITKYDLIKNISKAIRDKYKIEYFYPNVVYEDIAKNSSKRNILEKNIYK